MLRINLNLIAPALVLLAIGGAMLWKTTATPGIPGATRETVALPDLAARPVPPIDVAAPKVVETATFAYG